MSRDGRNEVLEEPNIGESTISNLVDGGDLEITSVNEMQDSAVKKVHRNRENEDGAESPKDRALLQIATLDNAISGILKNENPPIVKEQDVSKIEGTGKLKNYFWAISKIPQKRKRKEIIDGDEFMWGRNKSLRRWNREASNIANPVGDYDKADNHELEEENK